MFCSKVLLASGVLFGIGLGAPYETGVETDCTESIEVLELDFDAAPDCNTFPCTNLLGTYYFTGYDQQGTPEYTQPDTGAFFSVQIDGIDVQGLGTIASTAFTYDNSYFSPRWDHFSDVEFIEQCSGIDLFEIQTGALDGTTRITYFFQSTLSSNPTSYNSLYIKAQLNDCKGIGFDNKEPTSSPTKVPTPSTNSPTGVTPAPTDKPTNIVTPSPTNGGITCPNYDGTSYSSCSGDVNCANCQSWGCANCASGYYKMGLFQRCQSCTDNYPGCSQCGDWNGCTSCSTGSLQWEPSCNDEICK